jgi:hypothetical protein
VEVKIQRSDNQFWNGTAFQVAEDWNDATGTTSWIFPFVVAEDSYVVSSRATDADGYVESTATAAFTIDDTLPVGLMLTTPAQGAVTRDRTPTFLGAAGNASGDSTQVSVKIVTGTDINAAATQTAIGTRTGTTYSTTAANLSDGTYTAQASQTDAAGNTAVSNLRTFRVDGTGPVVRIVRTAIFPAANRATFGFRANERVSRFMCKLDARPWRPCTSPKTYSNLRDGRHVFRVKATDVAGNTGRPTARRFTI